MEITEILGYLFQAIIGIIGIWKISITTPRKRNLLIDALLEKIEESKSQEERTITNARTWIYLGILACSYFLLLKYSLPHIGYWLFWCFVLGVILLPFWGMSLLFILSFFRALLGKDPKIEKLEKNPCRFLCLLSFIISLFCIWFDAFISSIPKIISGAISLSTITQIFLLFFWGILGYYEYNRIKIEVINRFLKKNSIVATFCLVNKEKIKGKISKIEKDKVVILEQKASTWINQKDILYLELFE